MKPLKIGVSGVRGVVGETFTPELVVGFAQAFGTYLGPGRILVCRDTRPSGPMVASAVMAGLLSTGCDVVDLDVCPTPSLQLAVRWLNADGGISITAGHNPTQWNALKFVRRDGLYLTPGQVEELLDIYHQGRFEKAAWDQIRARVESAEAIAHHLDVLIGEFRSGRRSGPSPQGGGRLLQRLLLAARAAVAGHARVRGAGHQRRPVQPVPAHAGAEAGHRRPGPRAGQGRTGRRRPGPRRGRRAARPGRRERRGAVRRGDAGAGDGHRAPAPGRAGRDERLDHDGHRPDCVAVRGDGRADARRPGAHLGGDPRARRRHRRRGQRLGRRAAGAGIARQRGRYGPAAVPHGGERSAALGARRRPCRA